MGKGRRSDLNPPEGDTAQHRAGQSLWQCVDDWPQIPGYLRETLDADQVPRHAVAALRRSLDAGSVVAFVGSGVSMSYGRLGWSQLIQWMAQLDPPAGWQVGGLMRINALQATLDPNLRPGPKPSLTPHQQHMRK